MSTTTLTIYDAINIATVSHDAVRNREHVPDDVDVPLLAAARQLVQEGCALRTELERERARDLARPEAPRVESHPLQDGRDDGGRRHFVGGRSIADRLSIS